MAEVIPLQTGALTEVEKIILGLIGSRARDRAEAFERERRAEGRSLPGVDPLAGYVDPGLMAALGVERRRRRMGSLS
jgi:hypothetical protein